MVIYTIAPYWWVYLLICNLIPTLLLSISFQRFIVETPQFLINVGGDLEQAKQSLQKIADLNQATDLQLTQAQYILEDAADNRLFGCEHQIPANGAVNILGRVASNKSYLQTIICLASFKFGYYAFYYGVLGSLERTGFSFGFNMLILGLSELAGYILSKSFVHKVKRKFLLISSNLLKASIGLTFLHPTVSQSPILSSLVLMSTCILGAFNYSAITML